MDFYVLRCDGIREPRRIRRYKEPVVMCLGCVVIL
jgi:hypothetical protein